MGVGSGFRVLPEYFFSTSENVDQFLDGIESNLIFYQLLANLACAYLKGHLTRRAQDWVREQERNLQGDRGFKCHGGRYRFRNRGPSENFNRGDRRHGGRLNCLRVRVDQNDQSQIDMNPPIMLCMSPVERPYVLIL
ncbi:hypothetical protein TNCV_4575021 [Trichonephila clavipes]|nr:hypothetical protein TNCV_4575021 [Trichonephila clavipes]